MEVGEFVNNEHKIDKVAEVTKCDVAEEAVVVEVIAEEIEYEVSENPNFIRAFGLIEDFIIEDS